MADDPADASEGSAKTASRPRRIRIRGRSSAKTTRPASDGARSGRKKGDTGKRYTVSEQERILRFVADYNAKHGRGGISAANQEFGVSIPTLTSWMKREGFGGGAVASAAMRGLSNTSRARLSILERMAKIRSEILRLEHEFAELRRRI